MKRTCLPIHVIASRRRRRSNLKFHRSNKHIRETREEIASAAPRSSPGVALLPHHNDRGEVITMKLFGPPYCIEDILAGRLSSTFPDGLEKLSCL